MLRDILVVLIMKCKGNEQITRQLQTVGILHSGNRFQLLTMDIPKGYVCQAQRLDFYKVAGRINDPPLVFVIKDILKANAIIIQTLNLVQQEKTSNLDSLDDTDDDDKVERSNQRTILPPIALPSTFKTSNIARTKDVNYKRKRRKSK
ncbi:15873_t:CDS:1 [Gigaspora margarita]|uniref:15873_t:CDS:1 n=1 Tax=Gigaspora margarita TaxID=4874 RepID=A0ABN7VBI9_GIGMA|nr:15873_t:CDS:1 [Gigaspora margarita]